MKKQSKYYEEFEPIKDTPENVAKVLMSQEPKESKEWKYLESLEDKEAENK